MAEILAEATSLGTWGAGDMGVRVSFVCLRGGAEAAGPVTTGPVVGFAHSQFARVQSCPRGPFQKRPVSGSRPGTYNVDQHEGVKIPPTLPLEAAAGRTQAAAGRCPSSE